MPTALPEAAAKESERFSKIESKRGLPVLYSVSDKHRLRRFDQGLHRVVGLMKLRESLSGDAVRALRMVVPVTAGPDQPVSDAIALMQGRGEGCIIVTEHGKPIGVFTERDVLTKVLSGKTPTSARLADVMTSPPQTIQDGCSVASVIHTMHQGGFRHMPVVDEAGYLKGVVSVKRIVEYLVEHFPSAVFNLPPEPGQQQLAREGA